MLYATLFTIPSERLRVSDETTLTFAERPSREPEAILTWFYLGQSRGPTGMNAWPQKSLRSSITWPRTPARWCYIADCCKLYGGQTLVMKLNIFVSS
jgi:hypothetical protein